MKKKTLILLKFNVFLFKIKRIAHIKQSLKLYDQAVIDYFAVLNKMTNHVPTLKGKKI
jgi:hypothetical protein